MGRNFGKVERALQEQIMGFSFAENLDIALAFELSLAFQSRTA
jgi:hypothetical protein